MSDAERRASESTGPRPQVRFRRRLGWALTAAGGLGLLWGVLHVTSAGFGTTPERRFAQRRSYDMVKRGVHGALPGGLARALVGGVLLVAGARLRRSA